MSSLPERIKTLEEDLTANPLRISAYHDLPFAIFRYDPRDEYPARKEMSLLATRLHNRGRRVHFHSLAKLMWRAIQETEGTSAIAHEEQELGFGRAQRTVSTLLSDPDFFPLSVKLAEQMKALDPAVNLVFLVRAATFAPAIYRCAKLLDELHGRTMVPVILFYPGTLEGTASLRFMDIQDREDTGTYNYRVKIY